MDFDKSHYEKIRKVYSIWLCKDPPSDESGITQYRVQENLKYGMIGEEEKHYNLAQSEEGMVDIMCNLSVGIAKAGVDKGYLLGRQDGRIEGRQEGVRDGVRLGKAKNQREVTVRMLENHMPLEIIVRITGQSEDDIKRIAEEESLPC